VNRAEKASAALRQALDGRADHAEFVAITSRRTRRGALLLWRDYLSREGGILLAVNDPYIEETVEDLLAVLREWKAAASQPAKKPSQSCSSDTGLRSRGKQPTSRFTAA
jgi:hypothetical protein